MAFSFNSTHHKFLYLLINCKYIAILYISVDSKGAYPVPKVSTKRQITLPIDQCRQAHIEPGDEYNSYVDNNGFITIIKSTPGAAKGVLKGIKTDKRFSDEASLQSSLNS